MYKEGTVLSWYVTFLVLQVFWPCILNDCPVLELVKVLVSWFSSQNVHILFGQWERKTMW